MLIRLFGLTNPTGDYLYKKIIKEDFSDIYCYSRYCKEYNILDINKNNFDNLKKICNKEEIWISMCPIWIFNTFMNNLIKVNLNKKFNIKAIICCSSTSIITKKYSWHNYDKELIEKINIAENNLIAISNENKYYLSIIRTSMVYGNSGKYLDKNLNRIINIIRKIPFLILPKSTGKRQPIHISQLSNIIYKDLKDIIENNNLRKNPIINVGGDQTLTYKDIVISLLKKKAIIKPILYIENNLFFLILSPLILVNSRFYSEILRLNSDLSGFNKTYQVLNQEYIKFVDLIE